MQQKKDKRQVNEKNCNLEREYRDCIKSRRDKIGITRHIMMHQVLYIVQLPNEEGDMHIIESHTGQSIFSMKMTDCSVCISLPCLFFSCTVSLCVYIQHFMHVEIFCSVHAHEF